MSSYGIAKEGEGGAEVGDGKVRASTIGEACRRSAKGLEDTVRFGKG